MDLKSLSLDSLSAYLQSFFSRSDLDALGKSTRFVQRRTSKLDGFTFLLMSIFESYSSSGSSLNELCDWLEEHFGIEMRKQSLDERYNTYAVSFMRECFLSMLQLVNRQIASSVDFSPFKGIHLTDSTSFKVPAQLRTFYKGFSGKSGESVVKIHLNYDLLSNSIADIRIGDGCSNDGSYRFGAHEQIQAGGIYLRDLGYYSFDYFTQLANAGAYFLSRAKTDASFFLRDAQGNYERLDLATLLGKKGSLDLPEVYIGGRKEKLKVRVFIERVPEKVVQKRLAALKRYASKHKKSIVSRQRKAMCHFNVFITNIPSSLLDESKIRLAYSLRWQVELVFKIWKSHYKIDQVGQVNIFRFECHLYAKLIAFLIAYAIQGHLSQVFMDEYDFELSPIKASKLIKKKRQADESTDEKQ